jgi:hypothetical protein
MGKVEFGAPTRAEASAHVSARKPVSSLVVINYE